VPEAVSIQHHIPVSRIWLKQEEVTLPGREYTEAKNKVHLKEL